MKSGRIPRVILKMLTCKSDLYVLQQDLQTRATSGMFAASPGCFWASLLLDRLRAFIFEFRGYDGILDRLEFLERYTGTYDPRWEPST